MKEFRDSTGVAGDRDELRRRLRTDGYVFFRGLLDPEPLHTLADEAFAMLQREGHVDAGATPREARIIAGEDLAFGSRGGHDPKHAGLQAMERFNRVPYDATLWSMMRTLVADDVFPLSAKVGRVVYPGELVPLHGGMGPHQDFSVHPAQDMFTTWIPFVDVPRVLGGLAVEVGGHCRGILPRGRTLDPDGAAWATTDYRVGDVIVFHCLTPHAALPNGTDRLRLSADYRWQSASRPAIRYFVQHVRGPRVGEELWAAEFSTRPWWTPAPSGLDFLDILPGSSSEVPASDFVDVPAGAVSAGLTDY